MSHVFLVKGMHPELPEMPNVYLQGWISGAKKGNEPRAIFSDTQSDALQIEASTREGAKFVADILAGLFRPEMKTWISHLNRRES